ncbi:MAG: ATP-binding protein [Lachnospiraceae bacterium]|nr:ATP-binding protein [Lachnospiraceae bacterium]
MNTKENKKILNIINMMSKVTLLIVAVIIIAIYISGLICLPKFEYFDSEVQNFTEEWTYEKPDGSGEAFTMPVSLNTPIGEAVTIHTTLPYDIASGEYFCILTGHKFDAFVDGEPRFSFDNAAAYRWGGSVKAMYVPIPILPEDGGKTITLLFNGTDANNGTFREVVIGDKRGIHQYVASKYGIDMYLAFILAIFAFITLCVFTILSIIKKETLPLVHLASGVLVCSLWVINDSNLFQFVIGKPFIDGIMGYMMTLVVTVPFCLYMNRIQGERYAFLYALVEAFLGINFIVVSILHFSHIVSYERSLLYIDMVLLVVVSIIFAFGVYDVIENREKVKESAFVYLGMGMLIIFAVAEIAIINISVVRNDQVGGILIIVGLYILLFCAIMDQITRLRTFQLQSQAALAATKAKSDFLANMSHEIRTPINAIMGMNEIILRESKDENITNYAKDIYSASSNLLNIVNDILDFSKIESGKMEIIDEKYNLGEVISYVTSMIKVKADEKKLKFNVTASEKLPTALLGDSKRITEVFINILNNAVKYTPEGEVSLVISSSEIDSEKVMLEFYVKDTGIGIKPEDRKKLFEDFERIEYSRNKDIEGSGLGLAITQKLITLMGGTIDVESEYGVGSKFSVAIPQTVIDGKPLGDYTKHKNSSQNESDKKWGIFKAPECHVLVVDDNRMNLMVIKRLLAASEVQITTAERGSHMLELIKTNVYDAILLDHMMPDMDGIETLRQARQMPDNKSMTSPVIALTANAVVGAKEMYVEVGFDDYLSKPINPLDLENMLVKYLPEDKVIMTE